MEVEKNTTNATALACDFDNKLAGTVTHTQSKQVQTILQNIATHANKIHKKKLFERKSSVIVSLDFYHMNSLNYFSCVQQGFIQLLCLVICHIEVILFKVVFLLFGFFLTATEI
jgi:hypothetical protein